MADMNSYSKRLLKSLTPPIVCDAARALAPRKAWKPQWNELGSGPAKGIRMFMDPTGGWQEKMLSGGYDSFLFDRIAALKPKGKTIYDIGAHVGFHTLYFARLAGPTGLVASFEPNKANFERIMKNLDGNPAEAKAVRAFNIAAADAAGTVEFTSNDEVEGGRSTGGFIAGADTHEERGYYARKGFTSRSVEALPLDLAAERLKLPPPQIMKIDVEGAEAKVLAGARKLIASARPIIFVEVHSIAAMHDTHRFFDSAGYKAELINTEPNGVCYLRAEPRS